MVCVRTIVVVLGSAVVFGGPVAVSEGGEGAHWTLMNFVWRERERLGLAATKRSGFVCIEPTYQWVNLSFLSHLYFKINTSSCVDKLYKTCISR